MKPLRIDLKTEITMQGCCSKRFTVQGAFSVNGEIGKITESELLSCAALTAYGPKAEKIVSKRLQKIVIDKIIKNEGLYNENY